ncbi:reverse transcriptase domain-containing protein [Tanacetum coccineum]
MEELCQPSIDGRGGPIAPIPIQATDFGLRHHLIQQVQNTCQFHRLSGDDANRHIDNFLEITQHMKQNRVSDDALHLSLFRYSLTHHAIAWYDRLPRNSIHSFDDMMRKFLSEYFPPSMVTKLRNEITKFEQKPHESLFEAWERYKLSIDRCPNHNMLLATQIDTFYNGLTLSHQDTINVAAGGTFMQKTPEKCYELIENMTAHHNHWDTSATRDETSRNISSTTSTESPKVVRQLELMNKFFLKMMRQIQKIKSIDTKCETCGGPHSFTECLAVDGYTQEAAYATTESTAHVQPPVVQDLIPEPEVALKPTPKPSIPYPLRLNDQKLREKANNQMLKFFQIFQRLHFDISFVDALLYMPKFASTFKSLLSNKEKLFELASTPLNENCSAVRLKKLPEKHRDLVDYDVDPRVPLILGRPFLRMAKALIDVHGEEMTLQVLGFSDSSTSGNPTPSDPIIASSSPRIDDADFDSEGDIHLLKKLLNEDPSPTLPPMKNDDPKQVDVTMTKPSTEEPPKLELKDLPSHLENAFLEGTDKLPVIISKELKDEEKAALLKILMEDDFKSAVQHQRRVNSKIHEIIKKEVIKLIDAGLIYPISDSPWVSPGHYVPKKGGMTVVENEDNELIPTSKTMTDAQAHYMTMEKELLAVVYAFEKFRPYLVLSKTIVYTDHSALKYLLAKQNAKPRLLMWILLLQEFDVIIRDKKGDENLAANHLSRLENPHQSDLENKEITETFPLDTLGMVTFCGDLSTSWFADIANYHAGNFIIKVMSS